MLVEMDKQTPDFMRRKLLTQGTTPQHIRIDFIEQTLLLWITRQQAALN